MIGFAALIAAGGPEGSEAPALPSLAGRRRAGPGRYIEPPPARRPAPAPIGMPGAHRVAPAPPRRHCQIKTKTVVNHGKRVPNIGSVGEEMAGRQGRVELSGVGPVLFRGRKNLPPTEGPS
jgi:hypothetical protein